ncbi:hypothetical protein PGH47_36100 [Streptomyces sp. HUAS 31]|uniref:hypothetical protein n=1 Tax=Streptomyces TaxID=1883 RepID=UPI0023056AA7|nr:hypothetical protein [Streptomyces sp. HUAS 31]WCE00806.1 hypothetical protein PGH47_36100 [Streptomyces sp. HUAS 31]
MVCVTGPLLYGAAAGAAGATALDVVSYGDMVVRGRPASSTPETTVRRLAQELHVRIPGEGQAEESRVSALGALTGLAAGTGMGVMLGLGHAAGWRPTRGAQYTVAVLGALVATNGPMTVLGVTDPRTWATSDWISDIVPHLAYAVVTVSVFNRLLGGVPARC